MHLVKWIRKNMTKLMAVFVILIMIAFIMPTLLNQLAKPRSSGPGKAMWYFNKDKKISFNDIRQASTDLAAMRSLSIDKFLINQRDLRFALLGELIFPESVSAAAFSDEMKRIAIQNQLCISPSRIDDFFEQNRGRTELFWIMLKEEAKNAGCVIPPQTAGEILNQLIPNITNNKIDAATAVQRAAQANQMTDDKVLAVFADILTVASYARILTDIEDVTEAQIARTVSGMGENITAEYVEFKSETFVDKVNEPNDREIALQFNKYKNYFPDVITEDNPCGFGYKQRPRVAVEYIIVKLEDVKKLVTPPTEEETEEFYQQNLKHFVEQVPTDINDPNSQTIERQRSYAEVAGPLRDALLNRKVNSKAAKILNEVVDLAEAEYDSLDFETATVQQFKEKTKDYAGTAEKIAQQNNLKIYTGKTAPLMAEEFLIDPSLGSLIMQTQSGIPTRLVSLVFAVEQLGTEAVKLGPFEPAKPKMYVSIGPLTDGGGTIMAMARVIETTGSAVPADINFSYERNLLPPLVEGRQQEPIAFSLKETIKQDCRKLAAFEIARQKANEFVKLAKNKGWDKAIEKFNLPYPAKPADELPGQQKKSSMKVEKKKTEKVKKKKAESAASEPKSADAGSKDLKTFEIQHMDGQARTSQADIELIRLHTAYVPGTEKALSQSIIRGLMIDAFYSRLKDNQTEANDVPLVIEFKPQLDCYAVKSLRRNPVTTQDYERSRQQTAFMEDYVLSQSMAFEHFMPDNIIKRLNFRPVYEPNKPAEKTKTDANGAQI